MSIQKGKVLKFRHIFSIDDGCLINDGGYRCKSPFSYKDKEYHECTKAGGYKTHWCYDESGSWDWCSNCVQSMLTTLLMKRSLL